MSSKIVPKLYFPKDFDYLYDNDEFDDAERKTQASADQVFAQTTTTTAVVRRRSSSELKEFSENLVKIEQLGDQIDQRIGKLEAILEDQSEEDFEDSYQSLTSSNVLSSADAEVDRLSKTTFVSISDFEREFGFKHVPISLKEKAKYQSLLEAKLKEMHPKERALIRNWIEILRKMNHGSKSYCIYEEHNLFPGCRVLITPDEKIFLIYNKKNNVQYPKVSGKAKKCSVAIDFVTGEKYASLAIVVDKRKSGVIRELKGNALTERLEGFNRVLFGFSYRSEKNGNQREKVRLFSKWGDCLLEKLLEVIPMTVPQLRSGTQQLLNIVAQAHKQGLVIRDIKPDNIILMAAKESEAKEENFCWKMIDLAEICELKPNNEAEITRPVYTEKYASPEILLIIQKIKVWRDAYKKRQIKNNIKEEDYYVEFKQLDLQKQDAWSLGVTLFSMWLGIETGIDQFFNQNLLKILKKRLLEEISEKEYDSEIEKFGKKLYTYVDGLIATIRVSFEKDRYPKEFGEIICKLLEVNPEERWSVQQALTSLNSTTSQALSTKLIPNRSK